MILSRSRPTLLIIGTAAAVAGAAPSASSEQSERITVATSRCDVYGPGFVELGNGGCAQVSMYGSQRMGGHIRIDPGPQAAVGGWSAHGASNAALRSDGLGMLPGAADARHLRVQSGEAYGR